MDQDRATVLGTWNNPVKQKDVGFDWTLPAEEIVRLVAARDGAPGVQVELLGTDAYIYDVQPGGPAPHDAEPGEVVQALHDSAIRVAVGPVRDGHRKSVWVGCIKTPGTAERRTFKVPASWWVLETTGHTVVATGPDSRSGRCGSSSRTRPRPWSPRAPTTGRGRPGSAAGSTPRSGRSSTIPG